MSSPNAPLDLLAIFAHPDDAELLAGGALIRSSDLGERAGILDLTRGEKGTRGTPEIRDREAQRAAGVIGAVVRRNAGLPDAGIQDDDASRRKLATILREMRPRVVVTHWLYGRHPDHGAAARLVANASFLSGLTNLEAPGDPFRPSKIVHAIAFREDAPKPSFVVDVTDQIERKLEALACYESQFEGVSAAGEVLPGGDRPLEDQVRAHLAFWGSRIRRPYGEPYWTRETLQVPSLGGLGVSSF